MSFQRKLLSDLRKHRQGGLKRPRITGVHRAPRGGMTMITIRRMYSRRIGLVVLTAVLLAMFTLVPTMTAASGGWPHQHHPPELPGFPVQCELLAADVGGNLDIKSVTSQLIPASGSNKADCQGNV